MLGSELVTRRGATLRFTCAAALLGLGLPGVASARVVEPVWVSKQVHVAAGQTKSVTLKCPARAVALNGTASNAASSIPAGDARRWTFRFNRSGSAVLRCVRLRLPHDVHHVNLVVGTVFEPVFEVPPGFTQTIAVRCPSRLVPTGWGLERRTDDNGLAIAGAIPTEHGWRFQVQNTAPIGAAGSLAVRCLEKKQRAPGGQRHIFSTRIASFTEEIDGGGTTSRTCAPSEYSVATGVALPAAGDLLLTGTSVSGERDASWTFASKAAGSTAVRTSLICLARTTGFHG